MSRQFSIIPYPRMLLRRKNGVHYCWNNFSVANLSSRLSESAKKNPKIWTTVRREYAAVHALLIRSGLRNDQLRHIHSSFRRYQSDPSNDGKKPNDEDKDKISSLLAKAFLWMLTAYMVVAIVSLLFPSSNQPEVVRYVSWNEFLYQMLAKGEVEEIIVRPDIEIVSLVLHDGAVIKGKKAEAKVYHMNVVDINKFEDKLREAERRLGIQDGVPVIYERSSDTAAKLLVSLAVAGILVDDDLNSAQTQICTE